MAKQFQIDDTPDGAVSESRRKLLASHAKALVAIGATLLTSTVAHAAPRPPCFLRGTKIGTADGEVNVEDIAVGDQVATASGQARTVEWVGKWQARRAAGTSWSKTLLPVRIKRSALAPNVPYDDLLVSQGHAIFVDGLLIPAGELVNGQTIVIDAAADTDLLEYFHIKLASHDVILANGLSAETLLRGPKANADFGVDSREHDNHTSCAPTIGRGFSGALRLRARRMVSPLVGSHKLDIIRDRLTHRSA
jgi:hypothetical protein